MGTLKIYGFGGDSHDEFRFAVATEVIPSLGERPREFSGAESRSQIAYPVDSFTVVSFAVVVFFIDSIVLIRRSQLFTSA